MKVSGLFAARFILSSFLALLLLPLASISAETKNPASLKSVYALKYGEGAIPNYAAFWLSNPKFSTDQPKRPINMYFWLIQTTTRNILVDTGTGREVEPAVIDTATGLPVSDPRFVFTAGPAAGEQMLERYRRGNGR